MKSRHNRSRRKRAVVGIDIGKQRHAAAAITASGEPWGKRMTFPNRRAGIDDLESRLLLPLGGPGALDVAMEATGHYWLPLYFELSRRGYEGHALNALQTRAKFQSRMRKTKTDKIDALSIAQLFLTEDVRGARVPAEDTFSLRLLTRHRWRLVQAATDLRRYGTGLLDQVFPEYTDAFPNPWIASSRAMIQQVGVAPAHLRLEPDAVREIVRSTSRGRISEKRIDTLLEFAEESIGLPRSQEVLEYCIAKVLDLIEAIEAQRKDVEHEVALRMDDLNSPLFSLGLGCPIVATIHAESDPISDFPRPKAYVGYAGLDPSTNQSGSFSGSRASVSKRGSPYLRHALFLAAAGLYRHDRSLQRVYQRRRKAGRHHTDALVMVAHKLARIVWRLLTDNRAYRKRAPSRPVSRRTRTVHPARSGGKSRRRRSRRSP